MSSVTHVLFHPEALSGGNSATPQRKSLQSLDVIDNFLFTTLSSLPDVAEPFFRIILRSVFGYDFPEIRVTAEAPTPAEPPRLMPPALALVKPVPVVPVLRPA